MHIDAAAATPDFNITLITFQLSYAVHLACTIRVGQELGDGFAVGAKMVVSVSYTIIGKLIVSSCFQVSMIAI